MAQSGESTRGRPSVRPLPPRVRRAQTFLGFRLTPLNVALLLGAFLALVFVLNIRSILQGTPRQQSRHTEQITDDGRSPDEEDGLQTLLEAAPSDAFCERAAPPVVCAHGGDTDAGPPNTLTAFRAAVAAGVSCVEVDVSRTRDGALYVLHPRELRTLLGRPDVPQVVHMDAHEVAALRWPQGEGVPLVADVIAALAPLSVNITLDIKLPVGPSGEALDEDIMAQMTLDLVNETGCFKCLVWCRSDAVVRFIKEAAPTQLAGYIVIDETEEDVARGMHAPLRLAAPEVVGVHHGMATRRLMALAHGAGKRVHAWTADTPAMMQKTLDVAVDAIVTSYPRRLQSAILARLAKCDARR